MQNQPAPRTVSVVSWQQPVPRDPTLAPRQLKNVKQRSAAEGLSIIGEYECVYRALAGESDCGCRICVGECVFDSRIHVDIWLVYTTSGFNYVYRVYAGEGEYGSRYCAAKGLSDICRAC